MRALHHQFRFAFACVAAGTAFTFISERGAPFSTEGIARFSASSFFETSGRDIPDFQRQWTQREIPAAQTAMMVINE
jgi:hypothetical protein